MAPYTWSGGSCARTTAYVAINIGTEELGAAKPTRAKPTRPCFGLSVGRFPGSTLPLAGPDGAGASSDPIIGVHS